MIWRVTVYFSDGKYKMLGDFDAIGAAKLEMEKIKKNGYVDESIRNQKTYYLQSAIVKFVFLLLER